jgi:hypothetical protein
MVISITVRNFVLSVAPVSLRENSHNLEATLGHYRALVREIKQLDASFVDDEFLPPGGIAGLIWQGRANLINSLHMQRAVANCRMRGDVGSLQVKTLRFLQDAVDAAYEEAVSEADASRLQPRSSREGDWRPGLLHGP